MSTIETTGPKFTSIQKALKKKNAAFNKLTKQQQRMTIAWDVLEQLRLKRFVAASVYFRFGKDDHDQTSTWRAEDANLEMSECVAQSTCQVCGIGSLFAGAVLNADKLKLKEYTDIPSYQLSEQRKKQVDYLMEWFSKEQLDLIEVFFEHWKPGDQNDMAVPVPDIEMTLKELRKSPIYTTRSKSQRLKMIMQNIMSNGGVFNPFAGKFRIA